jgi:ferredoxin-NADP reductase
MTSAVVSTSSPTRWQEATLVERRPQTTNITSFFLKLAVPFAWQAGQHVDIRLTAEDGYRAIRSYSIANVPDSEGTVELAIERLSDGEVSPFFHDIARVGDIIEIRGPLGGHFVWSPADEGPIFLVGGGSGLVPLMAMIRRRATTGTTTPFRLLLSARTYENTLFRSELEAYQSQNDGFAFTLAITREQARRKEDFSRRIDGPMIFDVLRKLPSVPSRSFVCGTNAFVNIAADSALAFGVPEATIATERYGGL